ncbi:WhiB family transcriptional regulator [Streptomyces sp. NBC_01275]|uniref:WhiB family transcriptional regulator n=1 Tax=Streptomyces sp. NBC_01275 TaxID=2903807 RepID=UPI00224E6FFC|nr:WhiB family transcriptional regulator [Streptomyces sp. NBC_01275]MCX4767950.1 WhiB family transcriptional regulator [Streptomyces sp. NBC_01275]
MDWRHLAECRNEPDLFFPADETPESSQASQAVRICRRCPVAAACLNWALKINQQSGIWGGHTTEERNAMKRKIYRARWLANRRHQSV